ncbi:MAG TPA: hypothetical protein VIX82_18765 [Solirubrobacteraceae bacterium]
MTNIAARLLLAGKAAVIPKQTDGIVETIRVLRVARNSAVKARSAALVQIRDVIITAPQSLRDQLAARRSLPGKASVCARFPIIELAGPMSAAKFALRSIAQRIETLDREIAALDAHLERLVAQPPPNRAPARK